MSVKVNATAEEIAAWVSTLPEASRKLAEEFPIGCHFHGNDRTLFPISYRDDGTIAVSVINPNEDYDLCVATSIPLPVELLRTFYCHRPK